MKNRKVLTALIFLIIALASTASAITTKEEADSMLEQSYVLFDQGDYQNAYRAVYLAHLTYERLSITGQSMYRADNLIRDLNSTISPLQKARYFFNIGSDIYITASSVHATDISTYQDAQFFARQSLATYTELNNSDGKIQAKVLVESIDKAIVEVVSDKKNVAENYYRQATQAFIAEEYTTAKALALNASQVFSQIPDTDGMSKSAALIVQIEEQTQQIKQNAAASYDRALDFYVQGNLPKALESALVAQNFYAKIEDREGISQTQGLITNINRNMNQNIEERKRQAELFYRKAGELLIIKEYANATEAATEAKNIYMELFEKAKIEEGNNPSDRQPQMTYYDSKIKEVNGILTRIRAEWGERKADEQAEIYYSNAQEYLIHNEFDDALSYAQKARGLFASTNNYVGISKAETLINKIGDSMSRSRSGKELVAKAQEAYAVADFENANLYAQQAKGIYEGLYDVNNTDVVKSLLGNITVGFQQREKASEIYKTAKRNFDLGNWENAKFNAQQAYTIFYNMNYTVGAEGAKQILDDSEQKMNDEWVAFRNKAIIAVAIIAGVLIVAVTRAKKKAELEAEFSAKQKELSTKEKMTQEEMSLKMEDETKKRVEDELKRMIEAERGAGGDLEPLSEDESGAVETSVKKRP
ncbi:Uncharacterised protein [uncultured archaeon]|nr:Uncharacterised protein [uncultured archaeon]